jgi:hypothetical protein
MFTVVIPTIWKPDTFEEQLNSLCCSEYVDEIILINNDKKITPNFNILNHKKILHVTPPRNLVVNPSWNLGVNLSNNNNICLLNDDILFDLNVFKFMLDHKEKTLCGLAMNNQEGDLRLVLSDTRIHGFGCMMFVRKDTYDRIPDNLIYLHGDDYLFHMNTSKGNNNYYIFGCENNEVFGISGKDIMSTSSSMLNIINSEGITYNNMIGKK